MRKKCFVFLMFFSIFGLLFLFAGNAYASEGDANNVAQQTSSLYVNEPVTINVDGYYQVFVNDTLIEENKTLSDSGYYYVKYVTKTTETQTIVTEEGSVSKDVEVYTETASEYYIVNIDVSDGEVYFEEKEINLALIYNVSYYLNDELIEEDTVCTNEGSNALKIVCGDESKTISFDIFKFNNKEDLAGKNFTTLQTVEYTENTSATILLNGEVFDGNITTFGNYNFIVYNTKNEEIGSLSFVIDVIVSINGVKYTAENATVELEKAISLSTYGKIEYSLEPLTQKLSEYNIYNGYVTYNPGQNTLNITGAGSYSLEMVFNVTPVTNIINNHSYTKEVLPIVSGGSVKINGYDFTLGTTIKTAGSYEMVISGLESDAVATYHFTVLEEELNASNSTFAQALIAAKTNNYMLLNDALYTSGDVVYKVGTYEFSIYYPTYEENNLKANPYTDNKYIKSKYYNVVTYTFEIELGLNIVADTEYYDNVTILFSGAETASLEFEGKTSSISSGYVASKVGNYILTFNENSYSFSVTPSLNVSNAQVYLDSAMVLKSYDFDTNSSVTFKLTCETGTDTSNKETLTINKETLTNSNVINKTLTSGSYSLTISTTYGYSKTINFIVVSSSTISRGAVYQNGKAFDINMYGVTPYLNSPATKTRVRSTEEYKSTAIYTVGKHYMTFEFNGVTTSIDVDTAIYFYILPVVTIDGEVTTSKALSSDLEATLTFKDGTGLDIENDNFDCISLDSKSNQDQIVNNNSKYYFDEIGYHYIYLSLDVCRYTNTLIIKSCV